MFFLREGLCNSKNTGLGYAVLKSICNLDSPTFEIVYIMLMLITMFVVIAYAIFNFSFPLILMYFMLTKDVKYYHYLILIISFISWYLFFKHEICINYSYWSTFHYITIQNYYDVVWIFISSPIIFLNVFFATPLRLFC